MPVEIKIGIEDKEIRALLNEVNRRAGNMKPVMEIVGETVLASIQKTFQVGGRPKWQDLADSTKEQRRKKGKWPGQILQVLGAGGGLLGSIHPKAFRSSVVISARKVYAAIQHFGGQAGPGLQVTIPSRPYMEVKPRDWDNIRGQVSAYLFPDRR